MPWQEMSRWTSAGSSARQVSQLRLGVGYFLTEARPRFVYPVCSSVLSDPPGPTSNAPGGAFLGFLDRRGSMLAEHGEKPNGAFGRVDRSRIPSRLSDHNGR